MKKATALNRIYDSRLFWIIISVIVSVILWMYVTASQGQEYSQSFTGVQVTFQGEDALREGKGLVVTEYSTTSVTVVLTGNRREISKLDSASLSAVIDLSTINRAAFYELSYAIKYPDGIDKSQIKVSSSSPSIIAFTVDKLNRKTVELQGVFQGSVAEGYVAEPIEFDPSTVKISGPDAALAEVDHALVVITRKDVDKTLSFDTTYVLVDADGNEVQNKDIELETEVVTAIMKVNATKEVTLALKIIDGGGATSANVVCSFSVPSITLAGDAERLAGINKIEVGTVNLADIVSVYEDTFPIVIDNDLVNQTGETEVTVKVEIRGLATNKFNVTNIETKNVTDGYTAEVVTKNLEVTIRATEAILDLISPNNITAVVDLKDIGNTTGRFTKQAKIYIAGFSEAGAIGDYNVVVNVEKK